MRKVTERSTAILNNKASRILGNTLLVLSVLAFGSVVALACYFLVADFFYNIGF